jgi:glycosyltransferase involved in cell wall biosynthesis
MRLLIVTLDVFGGDKKGGGERYVTELARALKNRDIKVEVVIVRSITSLFKVVQLDDPASAISLWDFASLVRSCDVVHVHQLNSPGFDYAALFAFIFRKPLILTDHGGGALTPGRALGQWRLNRVNAAGYVSAWSRQDVDPRNKIRRNSIIFGGGDHLPPSEGLPQRYNFGFVGRLLPHKGIHVIIGALPPGASLIVAGQPRDLTYFAELQRLADGKDVTFLADASDEVVASIHKSVDIFLVPSVQAYGKQSFTRPELLGLVALEALAAGTPVIGSDVGGLGELLRAANQIALEPGNKDIWRDALAKVYQQTPRLFDNSKFTWDAVALKCIKLYDSELSKRPSERGL